MREFANEWLLTYRALFVYGLLMIEIPLFLNLPRRGGFLLRAAAVLPLYFVIGLFAPAPIDSSLIHSIPTFCVSVLLFWEIFEIPVRSALYLCVLGHLLQSIAVNVFKMIIVILGIPVEQAWPIHFLCLIFFSVTGYVVLIRYLKIDEMAGRNEFKQLILLGAVASACVIIVVDVMFNQTGLEYNLFCRIAIILSCFFALCLQYLVLREGELELENQVIQQLLSAERSQYTISKESIDIINMKCHDLKHQIAAVRTGSAPNEQAALQEIEDTVEIYDSIVKTGNEIVDAVLTEKSLFCEKHKIKLTYMADAKELSFFRDTDLYALLGNAMDNAIECVMQAERENRFIILQIRRKNDLLSIHVENYCKVAPVFQDGLPLTTKKDKLNHGFGVKSIQYLEKRYGGHATFWASGDRFIMDVLIPVPKSE